jgi:NOL1/NOP2/sun family putative RNA methylase
MNKTFPDQFIDRYKPIIPDFDKFLSVLQTPLQQCFRINTLKATRQEVLIYFKNINIKPIPWCDNAYRVTDAVNIGGSEVHKKGLIYIQESVSMLPALALSSEPNDKILDMCAAPGSKTTQIAAMMHNQGLIIANDISKKRIKALKDNLGQMDVINTKVISQPAQKLGYLYPEYFDKVLLDAPCSLEGTIRNTPKVLKNWKEYTIKRLSRMQKGLINSAYKALKPGGVLVYSTCTFAPEENEAVVNFLFKKYPNITCEPIPITNIIKHQGLIRWRKQEYNEQIKNAVRIYPHDNNTEGFFIAKIKKH